MIKPTRYLHRATARVRAAEAAVGARLIALIVLVALLSGCSSLLPRFHQRTKSKWASYEEVQAAFDRIIVNETRSEELATLGFHPQSNPNVRILTYLDLIQRFMPNQSLRIDDLDEAVRACIQARERSQAWEVVLSEGHSRRYGNVVLDVTGFVKKTHETGWEFAALVLILDDRIVYKLASGQPKIDRYEKRVKPLGPLQELERLVVRGVDAQLD